MFTASMSDRYFPGENIKRMLKMQTTHVKNETLDMRVLVTRI